MDEIAVLRTKGKMNLDEYHKLMENEYWCEGQTCVDKGFADRVARVTCGETLSGSSTIIQTYNFLGIDIKIKIKISDCPFIGQMAVKLKYGELDYVNINSPLVDPNLKKFVQEAISNKRELK